MPAIVYPRCSTDPAYAGRTEIERLRDRAGLTQKDLGERAGVSRALINKMETQAADEAGQPRGYRSWRALRVAQALDQDLTVLFQPTPPPPTTVELEDLLEAIGHRLFASADEFPAFAQEYLAEKGIPDPTGGESETIVGFLRDMFPFAVEEEETGHGAEEE